MKIAKENNLWVVEDTAEAIDQHLKKKLGSYGNIGVFSFHGTKTMSTGKAEFYQQMILIYLKKPPY